MSPALLALRFKPRLWQQEALSAWLGAGRRGIVEVVTGAGKTLFAELCMAEAARDLPDIKFLILVPSISLQDQWWISLQEDLGVTESDIEIWSSQRKGPRLVKRFNVMVLNTARVSAARVVESGPVMLVVDECHRAGSQENARALRGSYTYSLGISATPSRQYDEGLASILTPSLGSIIFRYDLNSAKRDGIISDFELINVAVDLLPDEEREFKLLTSGIARLVGSSSYEDRERLKRVLRRRARVIAHASLRVPVAARLVETYRGARTLVFHEAIEGAEKIHSQLKNRGHSVTLYHSRISSALRRDNLRLFRRGAFDVLVACRALDEGINIPEVRVAVIASASASERQRIQRLGRVLRPAAGKERAIIFTIYATEIEEQRLARESEVLNAASSISWRKGSFKSA